MIATGGTIACRKTENGLCPMLAGEELHSLLPALGDTCAANVCDLMRLDSTDLTLADRMAIAQTVWNSRARYDGFVIAHGTDTLAYTAALLHHVLRNFDRPVVLTGSMLPMGAPSSDAPRNLLDAFRVASTDAAGALAVLHGSIMLGRCVSKRHSTAIDAFCSVGAPPAGEIDADGRICWHIRPQSAGAPVFVEPEEMGVPVIRLTPDLPPAFLDRLRGCSRVILAAYGAGGIPVRLEPAARRLIESGTRVYLTTQCPAGGVDLHRYAVGRRAEAMGAISLGARTIEDAIAAMLCGEI